VNWIERLSSLNIGFIGKRAFSDLKQKDKCEIVLKKLPAVTATCEAIKDAGDCAALSLLLCHAASLHSAIFGCRSLELSQWTLYIRANKYWRNENLRAIKLVDTADQRRIQRNLSALKRYLTAEKTRNLIMLSYGFNIQRAFTALLCLP
jgi:hypothetical protein